MGDFTRLADLLLTNDLDTALRLLDRQTSIGGGGGFLGLGIWRYRTATTSTPSTGQLQFDDTTIGDATELYVHAVNDNGSDMSAFLDLLTVFDLIYIQVQVDASQFVTLQIGTPSLASSVYTFPISQIQGQGTTPSNNTEVAVVIERSGGGGSGVSDHGALSGLADDDHAQYLHKDTTRNVTVGYTTDVEADTFTNPLVPDFQLEYFKTMTVTGDFTLNVPTGGNSHGEYYLTVDSGGPYTLTAGTNVTLMDSNVTLLASENYILNIHRYSATNVLAQLLLAEGSLGSQGLTVKNEGTPLSTLASTMNFVGAGVDATGTGAEKTITISSNNYINLPAAAESSRTIVAADAERVYYVDLNGGDYTLNLPAISTVDMRILTIKAIDSVSGGTGYTLTVDVNGTDTLDDDLGVGVNASRDFTTGDSLVVQANDDNSGWWIL